MSNCGNGFAKNIISAILNPKFVLCISQYCLSEEEKRAYTRVICIRCINSAECHLYGLQMFGNIERKKIVCIEIAISVYFEQQPLY